MAKHRSHIVRPVLAENNSRLTNKFDFVFSDDVHKWMHAKKSTDGRKPRKDRKHGIV